ncbi:metal-dependent hydrolase [Methanogenium organophilum]|uniref:Metal-dependent hydrolase n=1 Tax=Methanogenium organophilum TaxID=2199 RepID=A0A9X9S5E7_METOG|nr:metal-dependent hydrolase [Methanogenium organophilum]WAI02429.1 metal-dependent hydrolase [Methanogenium organophilum]
MLPAVHLLIGISLGIFLLYLTRDCRALIYCAVGSLLPDIIDKPIGHLVLTSLDNGRIFFHSLTICALVVLLGLVIFAKWRHPGLLFIAAGILSHQLADAMWAEPRSWFWPFLGWFSPQYHPLYFQNMFSLEFSSPSELLVISMAVLLFICLFQAWRNGNTRLFRGAAAVAGIFLTFAGMAVIAMLVANIFAGFLIYSEFQSIAICAISFLLGGVAFLLVSYHPPVWCRLNDLL